MIEYKLNLPYSQNVPTYDAVLHEQLANPFVREQLPPFWHGFGVHDVNVTLYT